MKNLYHLIFQIILVTKLSAQVDEIVNTYNLYFMSENLGIEDNCKKAFGQGTSDWGNVSYNNVDFIICGGRFDAWDYNVFEFFPQYKEFIPTALVAKFEKEFLFNDSKYLDPKIVVDFFTFLNVHIENRFDSTKHYFIVYNESYKEEKSKFFFVWENIIHEGQPMKISTEHTTFDKTENPYRDINQKLDHLNEFELIPETKETPSMWEKIPEDKTLTLGKEVFLFEKIKYKDFLKHRIDTILKACSLAIEVNVKIQRNSDWF